MASTHPTAWQGEMVEVVVGSRAIPYVLAGSHADSIVFLSALGTSPEMWSAQIKAFDNRYTVVAPDLSGHTGGQEGSLADRADDLAAVLDAVGLPRAHVVGLSIGGMIAQEFALRHLDRVDSLVLVNTTCRYGEQARASLEQRAAAVERDGMTQVADAILERWFTPDFARDDGNAVQRIRAMLLEADPAAYASGARAAAAVDTLERLSDIQAPVIVVRAEEDGSLPADASKRLVSGIEGAETVALPDVAHLAPVQAPDAFNRVLAEFVERAESDGPERSQISAVW